MRLVSALLFSRGCWAGPLVLQVKPFGWALVVPLREMHFLAGVLFSCVFEGAAFDHFRWSGGISLFFRDLAWLSHTWSGFIIPLESGFSMGPSL